MHSKVTTPTRPFAWSTTTVQMPLMMLSQVNDQLVATQGEMITLFSLLQSMHQVLLQHGR